MAATPSWVGPGLGDRLAVGIHSFLNGCIRHRILFAAVCRKWFDVDDLLKVQVRAQRQLPWLLLPSSAAAAQDPCFYCLLCRTTHRVLLPDDVRGARCCGSTYGGRLILALQQSGGLVIHNLHTGRRISMPEEVLKTLDPVNGGRMVIHAARVMTNARNSVAYVAAMSASTIAFWQMRISVQEPHRPHESLRETLPSGGVAADVLYYNGHGLNGFHVLTDDEEVVVYVPSWRDRDGMLTVSRVAYRFPAHEVTTGAIARYLVRYVDELLMVVRMGVVTPDMYRQAFHVFKLVPERYDDHNHDERLASWVQMPVIPSGIIILGRCCSISYPNPTYGIDFDGIYFIDDATSYQDEAARTLEPAATRRYPCSDMGWIPILEHCIYRIFPERPPSESSRAVWFFP